MMVTQCKNTLCRLTRKNLGLEVYRFLTKYVVIFFCFYFSVSFNWLRLGFGWNFLVLITTKYLVILILACYSCCFFIAVSLFFQKIIRTIVLQFWNFYITNTIARSPLTFRRFRLLSYLVDSIAFSWIFRFKRSLAFIAVSPVASCCWFFFLDLSISFLPGSTLVSNCYCVCRKLIQA